MIGAVATEYRLRYGLGAATNLGDRWPASGTRFGELEVDLARHLLRLSDEPVHLTPKEYDLLTALATRPGKLPVAALAPARGVGAGPVDRAIRLSWDTGVGMDAVLVADARDVALHIVLGDEVVA